MIPEEQWTKGQREFVGSTFPTPKGGVLTVVGVSEEKYKFICECSICSEDEELWRKESIKCAKNGLVKGRIPCGCARNPRWTENQTKIRVERRCLGRGYVFHGWYGKYEGNETNIDLENPETGNRWVTTKISKFFSGRGDPVDANIRISELKSKDDIIHINDFYKAGFTKDYKFWRSNDVRKTYWSYTCPLCSKDEYVEAGVCSGIFETPQWDLKIGKKSCRCSKSYRWSQEQREYQINKICREEGLMFNGWVSRDGYKNYKSKFKWVCLNTHDCIAGVDSFLSGRRCFNCWKNKSSFYGYYPDRKDEKDCLYIINFNNKYIKVGRAFNIEERFKGSTGLIKCSKVKRKDIKILQVFTSKHKTIYDTEQWLHEELRERCFEYNEHDGLWSNELFDLDCIDVLNYLLDQTDLEKVK